MVLNVSGYWTPLLTLIDDAIAEGFADASLKALFTVLDTPDEAATYLRAALS